MKKPNEIYLETLNGEDYIVYEFKADDRRIAAKVSSTDFIEVQDGAVKKRYYLLELSI